MLTANNFNITINYILIVYKLKIKSPFSAVNNCPENVKEKKWGKKITTVNNASVEINKRTKEKLLF